MRAKNIEIHIYALLVKSPATLGEIVYACDNAGHEVHGDREIALLGGRVLWGGVGIHFAEAIQALVCSGRVGIEKITMIDFLQSSPVILMNSPHFFPVRLHTRRSSA